jgi:DNA-binding MarR family transcriptional regulator
MKQPDKTLTAYKPALPCACATLRRAARAVTQLYNRALRETGLEVTQFTFLQVLALAGEVTQAAMAQILAIDSTTLSRSIKPLQNNGWIADRPGVDRRQRILRLTAAGRKTLEQATPRWKHAQDQLRRTLADPAWNLLQLSADLATAAATRGH